MPTTYGDPINASAEIEKCQKKKEFKGIRMEVVEVRIKGNKIKVI